jgi:hypothetical protein
VPEADLLVSLNALIGISLIACKHVNTKCLSMADKPNRNMVVIRKFKDPGNRARLKALARKLFDEALNEQDAPIQAAVKAEIAPRQRRLRIGELRRRAGAAACLAADAHAEGPTPISAVLSGLLLNVATDLEKSRSGRRSTA